MIERARIRRATESGITRCVAVVITGAWRYEQNQPGLGWPNVRHTFPDFAEANHEVLLEWADRAYVLSHDCNPYDSVNDCLGCRDRARKAADDAMVR